MANKKNSFLARLQAQAQKREAVKTEAHVEIDTLAMLFSAHDRLKVGPGRAPGLVNDFLAWKIEIAESILQELDEDQSKQKEILVTRRNLAIKTKAILGPEGWEKYKTLFPFLRDYW